MPLKNELPVTISYALLAGTGIYCLVESKDAEFLFCPHITFGCFAVNGILALIMALTDDSTVHKVFAVTSYTQLLFALPCINTQVWLITGYRKEISYAWAVVPLVPFVIYLTQSDVDLPLADLLIVLNLVALGAVSIINKLNYGIAAAAAYLVCHICVRQMDAKYGFVYNVGLCFFAYFSLRAVGYGQDLF